MVSYKLTNKAVEDLADIWEYTFEKWSEQQADKYYEMLIVSCEEIVNNPGLGKNYDGIARGLLGIRVNKHVIFYRTIEESHVEITRILHGKMDLKKRMLEYITASN